LPHIDTDATYSLQYATSLRMSPLGYANNRTGNMDVSFNDLDSYLGDLRRLVSTDHPDYLNSVETPQINSKILQIENELYAYVRPKQPLLNNEERHITALKNRGIKYLEVRLIDINPFSPTGVTKQQLYFMRVFITYCLLSESDVFLAGEQDDIRKDNENISLYGRDNKQKVHFRGKSMPIQDAYGFIADGLMAIATVLDSVEQDDNHIKSILHYNRMIQNMTMTPSCQLLAFMEKSNYSFHVASRKLSESHAALYKKAVHQPGALALQNAVATSSVEAKQIIESSDTVSFAKYIENYLCID
jgi:glutamate--cysteine ligase